MSNNVKLSLVIPTRNRSHYLERAVDFASRFEKISYEIIVSNNASSDNSEEILQRLLPKYQNLKIVNHKNLIPLAEHWDKVINEHAKGDYIVVLPDDDIIDDVKYLKDAVDILESEQDIQVVFAKYQKINTLGLEVGSYNTNWTNKIPGNYMFLNYNSGKDLFIPHLTAVFRKVSWEKVGGFKSEALSPDMFLWLKLSFIGDFAFINRKVAKYLVHESNLSRSLDPLLQLKDVRMLDELKHYCYLNNIENELVTLKKIKELQRFILRRYHSNIIKAIFVHKQFRSEWMKHVNLKYFLIDYIYKGLKVKILRSGTI